MRKPSYKVSTEMQVYTPLVSIVIPNYNCGDFLAECLDSVIAQDYRNLEIIVVDDGSTDNSKHVLISYIDRIRLISTANQGAAAARNVGISNAKGKFIAFLDSDDVWEPNKIDLQVKKMVAEGCDLIYCSGKDFNANEKSGKIIEAKYAGNCYPYFKEFPARSIIVLGCSGALLRSSLLQKSGYFDETFLGAAEDWDFFRRYCKYAKVDFLPLILVHYRRHEGSIMSRPTIDWYYGNAQAIINMFRDDSEIGFLEKRRIWAKFNLSALKTFIKCKEGNLAVTAFFGVFLPVRMHRH